MLRIWSVRREFNEFPSSLRGRESRAINKQSKDVDDDGLNDFNDDFSLIEAFSRAEAEGNISDEARGTIKRQEQGGIQGGSDLLNDDDDNLGAYGYGAYGGKQGNFISHACHFKPNQTLKLPCHTTIWINQKLNGAPCIENGKSKVFPSISYKVC